MYQVAYTETVTRPLLVALALICCAGCDSEGDSPVTPPQTIGGQLRPGPHLLQVTRTDSATCFSLGIGPAASAQLDMTVTTTSDGWRARLATSASGTLELTLNRQGNQVSGRGAGRGTVATVTVVLDNALTGGISDLSASGFFVGNVTYTGPSGDTVCTENAWTLTPR